MEFILTFAEDPRDFDLGFGEVTVIHTDYDPYTGDYEVTPKRQEQIMVLLAQSRPEPCRTRAARAEPLTM